MAAGLFDSSIRSCVHLRVLPARAPEAPAAFHPSHKAFCLLWVRWGEIGSLPKHTFTHTHTAPAPAPARARARARHSFFGKATCNGTTNLVSRQQLNEIETGGGWYLTLSVWPLRHKERSVPNYMPIKDSLQMSSLSLSLMAHVGRSGEDQAVRGRGYPISASDSTSATPPVSTSALRMEEFGRYSLLHTTCERLHAAMSTCRQIASSPHSTPHSTPHSPSSM